jgi:hypothetical protein
MKKRRKQKPAAPKTAAEIMIKTDRRTVENPDWRPDRDGEPGFPRYAPADLNVKESAVETLYARKFLGSAQKLAADRFRDLWEAAGGKTASLDYTLDRVDGGKGDPIVGRIRAAQELVRLRSVIGQRGYEVLEKVCGEGKALTEISPHKRDRLTMADNLRADLDDAATMWGMQTRQRHLQRKAG